MENRMVFIGLMRPTRPGFAEQLLAEEVAAMIEHEEYLHHLMGKNMLFLAGPCLDRVFGFAIIEAESLEAASLIMELDPLIKRGVMTSEVHPCYISHLRTQQIEHLAQPAAVL